jgi:hypothetical protein
MGTAGDGGVSGEREAREQLHEDLLGKKRNRDGSASSVRGNLSSKIGFGDQQLLTRSRRSPRRFPTTMPERLAAESSQGCAAAGVEAANG